MPGKGVTVIDTDREYQFLHSHGLRALPGIGPKTAERMRALGLNTIADAVEVGRARLIAHFGTSLGSQIDDLVHGIDHRRVHRSREARSIGTETTFDRDTFDPDHLRSQIFKFSQRVIARAEAQGLVARTVSLKVRYGDLTLISRANTPDAPLRSGEEVARLALGLLDHISIERGIRLLGVHLSNFVGAEAAPGEQLSLFDTGEADQEERPRTRRLDAARMEIARRFGEGALDHASSVAPQGAISRNDGERPN
jgi:DNA polymerase-4